MTQKVIMSCLLAEVTKPDGVESPVANLPVKEGEKLAGSVTEDVGGFSIHPQYSGKQLRRIRRMARTRKEKREYLGIGGW